MASVAPVASKASCGRRSGIDRVEPAIDRGVPKLWPEARTAACTPFCACHRTTASPVGAMPAVAARLSGAESLFESSRGGSQDAVGFAGAADVAGARDVADAADAPDATDAGAAIAIS